jgi:hypothetical protein
LVTSTGERRGGPLFIRRRLVLVQNGNLLLHNLQYPQGRMEITHRGRFLSILAMPCVRASLPPSLPPSFLPWCTHLREGKKSPRMRKCPVHDTRVYPMIFHIEKAHIDCRLRPSEGRMEARLCVCET